jgi:hypothetical protein
MSIVHSFLDESKPIPQEVEERIAAAVKDRDIDFTDPDNPPLTEIQLIDALRYAREQHKKVSAELDRQTLSIGALTQ